MNHYINKNNLASLKAWLGSGSINIFGKPFSGKDTQAQRLAELFNTIAISSGDILRQSDDEETKHIIATGKLAPTPSFINLVLPFLSQSELKKQPLILSSIGRWHGEEDAVIKHTKQSGHQLKAVINLKIPDSVFYQRWEKSKQLGDRGSRSDDKQENLEIRLNEFNTKTLPVLEFYNQKNLLITIDGTKSRDNVTKEILESLLSFSNV